MCFASMHRKISGTFMFVLFTLAPGDTMTHSMFHEVLHTFKIERGRLQDDSLCTRNMFAFSQCSPSVRLGSPPWRICRKEPKIVALQEKQRCRMEMCDLASISWVENWQCPFQRTANVECFLLRQTKHLNNVLTEYASHGGPSLRNEASAESIWRDIPWNAQNNRLVIALVEWNVFSVSRNHQHCGYLLANQSKEQLRNS